MAGTGSPDALAAGPNLLLITLDTTRADHLGAYGYEDIETPNLDRLAAEGVRFEQAVAPVPITLPSHASLFTGFYPFRHRVRDNHAFVLAEAPVTLAEVLRDVGYETAGFVAAFVLDKQFGIAQGFERYTEFEVPPGLAPDDPRALVVERRGDVVAAEARDWILDRRGRYFAWLHLYDPHLPYDPPEPFRRRYAERPYDGEIAYVDAVVGRLLGSLGDAGRLEDTLVIVAGDHGEGLGDHGESEHGWFVYDSTVRVPLIFWAPGDLPAGVTVRSRVSLVDVLPTALTLLGVSDAAGVERDGVDLRPLVAEPGAPRPLVYAESLLPRLDFGWSDLRSLSTSDYKFILAPRPELYDLQADPAETRDLVAEQPRRAAAVRAELEEMVGDADVEGVTVESEPMSGEAVQRLLSLGYVGGSRVASRPDIDPKDKLHVYEAFADGIRRASLTLLERRWAEAIEEMTALDRLAEHYWVKYQLGRARLADGDAAGAIVDLERSLELNPSYVLTYVDLARAYRAGGRPDDGIDLLRAASRDYPGEAMLPRQLGYQHYQNGELEEALEAYLQARRLAPDDPPLLNNLAHLYVRLDRPEEALGVLSALVEVTPRDAAAWEAYGTLLAGREDWQRAEAALRRAVELAPGSAGAHYRLGTVLLGQGRDREAAEAFQEALAIEPGLTAAREALERLGR